MNEQTPEKRFHEWWGKSAELTRGPGDRTRQDTDLLRTPRITTRCVTHLRGLGGSGRPARQPLPFPPGEAAPGGGGAGAVPRVTGQVCE